MTTPTTPAAFPPCRAGSNGALVPLSDYSSTGAEVRFKVWTCTDPWCGFTIRIDTRDVSRTPLDGLGSAPDDDAEQLER